MNWQAWSAMQFVTDSFSHKIMAPFAKLLTSLEEKMIENLLPAQVASVAVYEDDASASLLPEEQAQFGNAVESRRSEFTTARACARQALQKLGLPPSPILIGPKREPVWPPGIVGSITHCRGYRAAAVASKRYVLTVGIDAEPHEELPVGVLEHVTLTHERVWLAQAPPGIHWDRLLFSAKECVYKAWFPITGRWLGFEDVSISFAPGNLASREGEFIAHLPPAQLPGTAAALARFNGRFMVNKGLLLTAVTQFHS